MLRFAMYLHGGSNNHGCEAIAVSTSELIKKEFPDSIISLLSFKADEDIEAGISSVDNIVEFNFNNTGNNEYSPSKYSLEKLILFFFGKLSSEKADLYFYSLPFRHDKALREFIENHDIFISVGGDNYCYGDDISGISAMNRALKKAGKKTVLWGCSVGKQDLTKQKIKDLSTYDLITARESITFELLGSLKFHNQLYLHADPAFSLEPEFLPLPERFVEGRTVGINISPLISRYEPEGYSGIGLNSVHNLIDYLIGQTDFAVALIPHVIKSHDNDMVPLEELYEHYRETGRICLIGKDKCPNARQLKGYIARCSFFAAARTHAAIAAYSSIVPALVLGYSVKSTGIARDIFGNENGLVLNINGMKDDTLLKSAFIELVSNEEKYRGILKEKMPAYIQSAKDAVLRLKNL